MQKTARQVVLYAQLEIRTIRTTNSASMRRVVVRSQQILSEVVGVVA